MAHAIIWSRRAAEDAEAITDYIAIDSAAYAAAMARRFLDAINTLSLFPAMGRHVPELDDDNLREVIVRSYRIIYRVGSETVHVVAIVHGARNLLDALGDRPL